MGRQVYGCSDELVHDCMVVGRMGIWEMGDWMNEVMFAWGHGSRYGTSGKVHKLQIPNPKERGTTTLLKTQYPMHPLPIPPIYLKLP
jgi:hypothetical protein